MSASNLVRKNLRRTWKPEEELGEPKKNLMNLRRT